MKPIKAERRTPSTKEPTMKKLIWVAALAAVLVAPAGRAAAPAGGFDAVLQPYEGVRRALVDDDLFAARAPAGALAEAALSLRETLTPEGAGVPPEKLADVEALLPQIEKVAARLAATAGIEEARDAFYELSKVLVRWRQAAGEGPAVVYCAMKKRSWLQPAGESVGNPYYGQSMPSCGQIKSK
jgi:hypothetical protein